MKQRVRSPISILEHGADTSTASVDYETDRNIQDTIAHEFKDRTILCIARTSLYLSQYIHLTHFTDRLRTIISYDRICVLDAGQIVVSIFAQLSSILLDVGSLLGVRYSH
jgi:ABC-type multidrug transport system fused ATPase/permease subunit